jgi:hypothetical protein
MQEYIRVRKDEYDRLKELEKNHRYLLSGELSYSNSIKNNKQNLQDKIDKVILHCNEQIELWKNDFDMIDIYQEVLERLGE